MHTCPIMFRIGLFVDLTWDSSEIKIMCGYFSAFVELEVTDQLWQIVVGFAFTVCNCVGEHGHSCAYMYLSYLSPIGIFLPCQYCLRRPCIRSTVVTGHQPVVCSKGYEKTQSPHCPKYTPDQGCSSHLHSSDPKPPWQSVKSSAPRRCPLCCPVPSPCPKEKQSGTPCQSLAWWGSCGKEKPQ